MSLMKGEPDRDRSGFPETHSRRYAHRGGVFLRPRSGGLVGLLCGLFMASGMQWDMIQIAAWSGMWLRNVQQVSLAQSVELTFSPQGMCTVCEAVQAARQEGAGNPVLLSGFLDKAPLLPPSFSGVVLSAPAASGRVPCGLPAAEGKARAEPAIPPPRNAERIA